MSANADNATAIRGIAEELLHHMDEGTLCVADKGEDDASLFKRLSAHEFIAGVRSFVRKTVADENVWLHDASTFRRLLVEFFDHLESGRLVIGNGLPFADHQLVRGFVDGARGEVEATNHRYLHEDDHGNWVDGNGEIVELRADGLAAESDEQRETN